MGLLPLNHLHYWFFISNALECSPWWKERRCTHLKECCSFLNNYQVCHGVINMNASLAQLNHIRTRLNGILAV
jgi:hypothetical protein